MKKRPMACSAALLPLLLAACGPAYTLPGHPVHDFVQLFQQTPSDYSVFIENTALKIERARTTFTVESGLCP